jgi:hypothetical protein
MNQRLLIALTLLNLALLLFLLLPRLTPALADNEVPILRGRALEIVDDRGRVRASIQVHAASTFAATGKKYPETVMLRLIDPNGRPEVKMGASVDGAGLGLVGASDTTQVLLQAEGAETTLLLKNKDGAERRFTP